MVKNIGCFCRVLDFTSQRQHGSSWAFVILVSEDLTLSFDLCGYQAHTYCTDIHAIKHSYVGTHTDVSLFQSDWRSKSLSLWLQSKISWPRVWLCATYDTHTHKKIKNNLKIHTFKKICSLVETFVKILLFILKEKLKLFFFFYPLCNLWLEISVTNGLFW